jgi:hypothetical protein
MRQISKEQSISRVYLPISPVVPPVARHCFRHAIRAVRVPAELLFALIVRLVAYCYVACVVLALTHVTCLLDARSCV